MADMAQNDQSSWVAVLCDVRGSRDLEDRAARQVSLGRLVAATNRHFAEQLVVPFSISGGDEIQALVADPTTAWRIVSDLDLNARTLRFRYGIGLGNIATAFAERSWEMDGSCFLQARRAIDRAKAEKRWLVIEGLEPKRQMQLDGLLRLMQLVRENWTLRQREAILVQTQHGSQKETAAHMGLDPSTLSKMLKAASYKAYLEAEGSVLSHLEQWREYAHD